MDEHIIKAVLFDLGDTLIDFGKIDTARLFLEAGKVSYEYLKKAGQPVPSFQRYLWSNLLGMRFKAFLAEISGNDFDSLLVLKAYGKRKGFTLTDDQWKDVNNCWYEPLKVLTNIEDDMLETLGRLRDAGLKMGIVSNTFVNGCSLDQHLRELEMLEFFPMRIYSYEVKRRKPHKSIFLEAARRIDTDPKNVMFVGDRINKDINGAIKAGMIPVLKTAYTNEGKVRPEGTIEIKKVSELPEIIENLNKKEL